MQTIRFNSSLAAHLLAAEERHRADLAAVERYRWTRSEAEPPAPASGGVRVGLGAALIRTGERLRGLIGCGRRPAVTVAGR